MHVVGTDIALVLGRVYRGFLRLGINRMFLLMLMRYSPFPIHVLWFEGANSALLRVGIR